MDAVAGSGAERAEEAGLPVVAGGPEVRRGDHGEIIGVVLVFADAAGQRGKEPAGGAAERFIFGAGIHGIEPSVGNEVLCVEADRQQNGSDQG